MNDAKPGSGQDWTDRCAECAHRGNFDQCYPVQCEVKKTWIVDALWRRMSRTNDIVKVGSSPFADALPPIDIETLPTRFTVETRTVFKVDSRNVTLIPGEYIKSKTAIGQTVRHTISKIGEVTNGTD